MVTKESLKPIKTHNSNTAGGDGAEVIYALRNTDVLSESIGAGFVSVGQNYRSSYQRRLPSDSSLDYYYMHRNTPNNETIIVEYGFLDSTGDDVDLIKNSWKTLTEGVLSALVPYVGGTYIPLDSDYIYIVQSGDTLYSIANKYGTTVDILKELNLLTSDILNIGQTIYLPGIEDLSSDTYTVKSGDTLYSIAFKYNLSVDELKELNNLTSDSLSIGQVLKVKYEEVETPIVYTVQSGDTLYSIANKFGLTVANLIEYNNLISDTLSIGQVLKLTNTEIDDDLNDETEEDEYFEEDSVNTYTVKSGDTLYSIANKYNLSVDELKLLNNLTTDTLSIGQVLYLNKQIDDDAYDVYTVKSGDTLYSIAKNYNVTYSYLMEINNLNSNLLSVGQEIYVPKIEKEYESYTVKSGDTLYKIATTYNTTVDYLKQINNLTSDTLSIGITLLVPSN